MTIYKISLMEAYLIETLRSKGISNEEIISKVKSGNVDAWQKYSEHFDFNGLLTLADKDLDQFVEILKHGYQVKFVTFNGLKNLLHMRFDKVQDKDYEVMEKGINNLVLNQEQLMIVKQMLSGNWVIVEEKDGTNSVVRIELV